MLKVAGTGCTLLDFVYTSIDFHGNEFIKYESKRPGDGGLVPGQLVFLEDLEKYSDEKFEDIVSAITGGKMPDAVNLGGPAVVAMIHAAQLAAGDRATFNFVASAGNDRYAEEIRSFIDQTPLKGANIIEKRGRTPFTYVLSDPAFDSGQGERTFINNIGAAGSFNIEDLTEDFFQADITVLGGTALVPQLHDSLDELLEEIHKDSFVIVNTVYDFRNEQLYPGNPWPLCKNPGNMNKIDLLIMDSDESMKISGTNSLKNATMYFRESPVNSFIITNGTRPVTICVKRGVDNDQNCFQLPVSEKILFDNKKSMKADTTGAGDNFTGGVIYSIIDQLINRSGETDLREAAKWGIVSGGFACSYIGGTYIEKQQGEKFHILRDYLLEYEKQLKR
ncbi:MAG: carbohydrate kinase family protein [Bacteroidales bacterium]|nr:carbohydrate kinase family protein [Bacteroidales bacterium]